MTVKIMKSFCVLFVFPGPADFQLSQPISYGCLYEVCKWASSKKCKSHQLNSNTAQKFVVERLPIISTAPIDLSGMVHRVVRVLDLCCKTPSTSTNHDRLQLKPVLPPINNLNRALRSMPPCCTIAKYLYVTSSFPMATSSSATERKRQLRINNPNYRQQERVIDAKRKRIYRENVAVRQKEQHEDTRRRKTKRQSPAVRRKEQHEDAQRHKTKRQSLLAVRPLCYTNSVYQLHWCRTEIASVCLRFVCPHSGHALKAKLLNFHE